MSIFTLFRDQGATNSCQPYVHIFAAGAPVVVVFTVLHHPHTDTNMIQSVDPDTLTNTQDGWKENLQS